MRDGAQQARIAGIALGQRQGTADLEVTVSQATTKLRWREDWDTSLYTDEVEVGPRGGAIRHVAYREDNLGHRTESVENPQQTLDLLRTVVERLTANAPTQCDAALELVRGLMAQIHAAATVRPLAAIQGGPPEPVAAARTAADLDVQICVNGRGNAWPVGLGAPPNPRQSRSLNKPSEYSNTSLSIRAVPHGVEGARPAWHVLFDIGQGIVPALVQRGDGLPDALILSHPHFDHVSGLDWLVQNYATYGPKGGRLPVFASRPCWQAVIARFPYLEATMELQELQPGVPRPIAVAPGAVVTGYPVFHGDFAPGATLILLESTEEHHRVRAIFTGDLLCPLLRSEDWAKFRDVDVIYADANTRFPWPASGHWSIVETEPQQPRMSEALRNWVPRRHSAYLVGPHSRSFDVTSHAYFDQFLSEVYRGASLCWSILEFVKRVVPKRVELVHYSGYEDFKHHGQAILTDEELLEWTKTEAAGLVGVSWGVPQPGDCFRLWGPPNYGIQPTASGRG